MCLYPHPIYITMLVDDYQNIFMLKLDAHTKCFDKMPQPLNLDQIS